MSFVVEGLEAGTFATLFTLDEEALRQRAIEVVIADDAKPGYPCRVSLDHASPGERLLLLNYEHQPANTPYRSSHAIYVAEHSKGGRIFRNEMPPALACRLLSLRAFDARGMMLDAEVVDGAAAGPAIERLLSLSDAAYIHANFAKRGCYAATIRRAS